MRELLHSRTLIVLMAVILVASLSMITGCNTDEPGTDSEVTGDNGDSPEVPGEEEDVEDGSAEPVAPDPAPEELVVRLYWVSAGENALGIERTIPYTRAVGTAALKALLEGPTEAETQTWPAISSAIPEDTELLGLRVENGTAYVDLSDEFDDGGGTFGVTARLAQVVYTLTQFPTVDDVEFSIEGERVEVFSSEGLILDGPQTPEDYYPLLPIDA